MTTDRTTPADRASRLERLVMAVLPRLAQANIAYRAYTSAAIDYYAEPTTERAMIAAEWAQEFNDVRYWWQTELRVAIWTRA